MMADVQYLHSFMSFQDLTAYQRAVLRCAIDECRLSKERATIRLWDGSEAYAYPGPGSAVCWGLNGTQGICIARGVMSE